MSLVHAFIGRPHAPSWYGMIISVHRNPTRGRIRRAAFPSILSLLMRERVS
jgi:hypothetical protein